LLLIFYNRQLPVDELRKSGFEEEIVVWI
jgi:hypothetical protein